MKLVVFDCDGTLADSQYAIVAAMNETFAGAGLALPSREAVRAVVGLSLVEAMHRLLPAAEPALLASLASCYGAVAARLRAELFNAEPLFPGAEETLRKLAARPDLLLGIATGKSRRALDNLLNREALRSSFATLQTADDHPSKPDPSMLFQAMSEVNLTQADTLMVGDSTYDVEMAARAGCGFIGVAWGYHSVGALEAAGARTIVATFSDIERAIDCVSSPLPTAS